MTIYGCPLATGKPGPRLREFSVCRVAWQSCFWQWSPMQCGLGPGAMNRNKWPSWLDRFLWPCISYTQASWAVWSWFRQCLIITVLFAESCKEEKTVTWIRMDQWRSKRRNLEFDVRGVTMESGLTGWYILRIFSWCYPLHVGRSLRFCMPLNGGNRNRLNGWSHLCCPFVNLLSWYSLWRFVIYSLSLGLCTEVQSSILCNFCT